MLVYVNYKFGNRATRSSVPVLQNRLVSLCRQLSLFASKSFGPTIKGRFEGSKIVCCFNRLNFCSFEDTNSL